MNEGNSERIKVNKRRTQEVLDNERRILSVVLLQISKRSLLSLKRYALLIMRVIDRVLLGSAVRWRR